MQLHAQQQKALIQDALGTAEAMGAAKTRPSLIKS
jgi:hypothetical protein